MDWPQISPLTQDERHKLVADIIGRWPDVATLAQDVGREPVAVLRWRKRGSIPGEYDLSLLQAALRRGIALSWFDLMLARWVHDQHGIAETQVQGNLTA